MADPTPEPTTITALEKRIAQLEAQLAAVPKEDPEEKKKVEARLVAAETELAALKKSGEKPAKTRWSDHFWAP